MTDLSGVAPTPPAPTPAPKLLGVNLSDAAKYILAALAAISAFLLVEQGKMPSDTYIAVVVVPILALVSLKSAANTGAAAANAGNQAASNATPTTVVVQSPPSA